MPGYQFSHRVDSGPRLRAVFGGSHQTEVPGGHSHVIPARKRSENR